MADGTGVEGWLVIVDKTYLPTAGDRRYDRIKFTYLQDNFSESKAANYSSTAILGRSEPVRGYLGSSPRAINLQLMIPVEGDGLPGRGELVTSSIRFVGDPRSADFQYGQFVAPPPSNVPTNVTFKRKLEVMDFIRSLVYPHYNTQTQKMVHPPPRIQIILGTWFSLLGIVTNYSMTHRAPWAPEGDMTPYYTDVSLTVEECDQPYSFQDVYGGILRTGGSERKQIDGPTSSRVG